MEAETKPADTHDKPPPAPTGERETSAPTPGMRTIGEVIARIVEGVTRGG